jgi:polar amino acid transport system substrate-binding protein
MTACAPAPAPSPEARRDLVPTGALRVGLFLGSPSSVIRHPTSGDLTGVAHDLGQELARRLGVSFEPVVYPSIGALVNSANAVAWDVAIFGVNPARSESFDFTEPLFEVEYGYLVSDGSVLSALADVDRPGVRVGVQERSVVESILSRDLRRVALVSGAGIAAGLEMLRSGTVDAFAASKSILFELSDQLPGSRVLPGRYATELQAFAMPKGRAAGLAYLRTFVSDAKAAGIVQAAATRARLRGAV